MLPDGRSVGTLARAAWCLLAVAGQAGAQPVVTRVANGASFSPALCPGGIGVILGHGLAAATESAALPLPRQLAGTTVFVRNADAPEKIAAPLYYVSPVQINFQVPFELVPAEAEVTVSSDAGTSAPFLVRLAALAPGIFSGGASGQGEALVFDTGLNPLSAVRPGLPFVFFAAGLGQTDPPARTGEGGSADTPQAVAVPLRVHVGGKTAALDSVRLALDTPGVYQVNVTPQELTSNEIYLEMGTAQPVRSNTLAVPVDPFNVRIIGTTATQAVIAYRPPSPDRACTVQVSEVNEFGSGYAPVHDVNPQLFAGADLDGRAIAGPDGDRIVVIGKRAAENSGSLFYSRALQADTRHYFKIACDGQSSGGDFRTTNIPAGNTWEDPLPADPNTPGGYAWPTLDTSSRSNSVIDPLTGVKIQVLTRPGDIQQESGRHALADVGGSGCALQPVTTSDGKVGYHCKIGYSLYWVEKRGVSSRLLGNLQYAANAAEGRNGWSYCKGFPISSSEPNTFYCLYAGTDEQHIFVVKGVYNGHKIGRDLDTHNAYYQMNPPLADWANVTPVGRHLRRLIEEFEPSFASFIPRYTYLWVPTGVQNDKLIIEVLRLQQDTIGWYIVFDPLKVDTAPGCVAHDPAYAGKPGCVIAAQSTYGGSPNTPNRWCSSHGITAHPSRGNWSSPVGNPLMSNLEGGGPYTVDVTAVGGAAGGNLPPGGGACPERPAGSPIPAAEWPCAAGTCAAATKCTQLTMGGEPASAYAPASIGNLATGDLISYGQDWRPGNSSELGRVLSRSGDAVWVERGYQGSPKLGRNAPLKLYMVCNAYNLSNTTAMWWWNWIEDPRNTYYNTTGIGGHRDIAFLPFRTLHVGVGPDYQFGVNTQPMPQALAEPRSAIYSIVMFPRFASKQLYGGGSSNLESHLRYWQYPETELESRWVADARPYFGDTSIVTKSKVAPVTGDLYRIQGIAPLVEAYKRVSLAASSGRQVLAEVSRPGQVPADWPGISGSAADNLKFCVALKAGECYEGSLAGDVYFNAPGITHPYCTSSRFTSSNKDICLTHQIATLQSLVQMDATRPDKVGRNIRVISRGLTSYRGGGDYWAAVALTDGRAILADVGPLADGKMQVALLRQPAWPAEDDGVDRSTFVPLAVPINPVPDRTSNVVVEFGYGADLHCTPRAEPCVANRDTVDEANPFYFAASEPYAGLACSSGCTVKIPAISQRVVYYRVKYRDAEDHVISTETGVRVSP